MSGDSESDIPNDRPWTLAIDVGGSGLKAALLDAAGSMMGRRVRVETPYPLPPQRLVSALVQLTEPLGPADRVSVGFPGMVRDSRVLSAPHFVTVAGPGTEESPELLAAWKRFDLADALEAAFGRPVKVANDADVQGSAVVSGHGFELAITLGTGMGTALFNKGRLLPHMELSHHPFRKGESYDEQVGDAARRHVGEVKWNRRVRLALETLDELLFYDHVYIGGGNSRLLSLDLGPKATIVDNSAGILGGIKLWERS
ncbi:MAG: ROK family protein [Acidimicrobiales bacterium]